MVPVGTKVAYHGSVAEFHGPLRVLRVVERHATPDYPDGIAYRLENEDSSQRLENVRPTSFTVIE